MSTNRKELMEVFEKVSHEFPPGVGDDLRIVLTYVYREKELPISILHKFQAILKPTPKDDEKKD